MSVSFPAWGKDWAPAPGGEPSGARRFGRYAVRAARAGVPWAVLAGGVLWLAIGLWAALMPRVMPQLQNSTSPGPGLDDFGVFYSAATMVRDGDGAQIYDLDALARAESRTYERPTSRDGALPYFNTPAFAAALVPLTLLPVGTAASVFLLATGVLCVIALLLLWRESRVGYAGAWLLFAMVLVHQSTQDTIYHGQLSFVLLFSFVSAFAAFRRGDDRLGGFALGLLLLKPNLLVAPLAVLLWKRRRDALIGLAAAAVICTLVSVAASGPSVVWRYPEFLRQASLWDDEHGIGIAGMFGWNAFVRGQLGPGHADSVLLWSSLLSLPTLAITLWTWRGPWRGDGRTFATQFSALVMCSLLINPHVYRQDMILMLIPGFLLLGSTEGRVRHVLALALFGSWAVFLYHFSLLRVTGWNTSAPLMAALLGFAALLTLRRMRPFDAMTARVRGVFAPAPRLSFASASPAAPAVALPWPGAAAPGSTVTVDALPLPERVVRPELSVIVPTRNEQDNILPLVARLRSALVGVDFDVVFVDDSNDATPDIVSRLDPGFPVTLIHRHPSDRHGGLTTAIMRGLRAAQGTYLCVIDGDLQHPPEKLIEMLREARATRADVVVASRYRAGGSAEGLETLSRKLISLASKWISKALFYERLRDTTDPGSGFFMLRRDVIDGVELHPVGYKMLTEILVRGRWAKIAEVPYRFQVRERGASNAGFRQGLQYLHHTLRIFVEVPDVAHVWRFLLVGATGVVVNLGLLSACTMLLGIGAHTAWAIAVEASVLSNFWWNHTFTWRDRRAHGLRGVTAEAGRYHLASIAGVVSNFAVFTAATLLGCPTLIAGMFGIAGGMAMNFAGSARFVFRATAEHEHGARTEDMDETRITDEDVVPAEAATEWGRP
jgi:dolichol-phosphate mannosyltransferase